MSEPRHIKLMGIVNLTPDSFLPSSRCVGDEALQRINRLLEQGADIIDIGAVSTRPGAAPVSENEEWSRLEYVISHLPKGIIFSIDTTRSGIVKRVYETAGPFIVNDISAGEDDPQMLRTVSELNLRYIAMHKRGTPTTMDTLCDYPGGVVRAVKEYFSDFEIKAGTYGITDWILDPGFGFAKTPEQNMELLKALSEFKIFGKEILVGISGKRFTRGREEECLKMAKDGGADILRVHEVTL